LDVFKGNIHGLFFPKLEEKKPPATVFTQNPQGLAGERSMGWWGGRVGMGLRPETAGPTAPLAQPPHLPLRPVQLSSQVSSTCS